MRINLGAAFAHLFKGESKATVTIKASENIIELFHKEDEKSLFPICKKSARYEDGWCFCTICQLFFKGYERCPTHGILLRTSRKKRKKRRGWRKKWL
jgi:phosphoribosylaminoimidazole-succinocarboxamide synthase